MFKSAQKTSQLINQAQFFKPKVLKNHLPEVYHHLLPESLLGLRTEEALAVCEPCSFSPNYRSDLKCCTYYPFMPNYLIGAVLSQESNDAFGNLQSLGTSQIKALIEKRRYALPIGLVAPVRYQLSFIKRKKADFGHREDWLCPYFNSQTKGCTIWFARSAVCTTFFCRSSQGSAGKSFWHELSEYLTYVEMALLEEFLAYEGYSARQMSDQLDYLNRKKGTLQEKKSWTLPKEKSQSMWGLNSENQIEFYKKSYLFVKQMNSTQFKELLGEIGKNLEKNVSLAYSKTKFKENSF